MKRPQRFHRRRRFHRHGLIRPTIGCLCLAVAAGGCCFGGLLLDDRTLMDVTIAAIVLLVCSLAFIIAQWHGLFGLGDPTFTRQIEQRDQNGNVVDRFVGEPPAAQRGLYVTVSTVVRWTAPLGLFAARKIVPASGQLLVLPEEQDRSDSGVSAVDKRHVGSSQSEHSGGVRAYAPGDPLKLISWRHTAHRGELMTRESSRDIRATAMLVLNTVGVTPEQLDAEVAALLPWARVSQAQGTQSERLLISDGIQLVEGIEAAERFLASVQPVADGDNVPSADKRAARIADALIRSQGPIRVLVCDASSGQALTGALARTPMVDRLATLDAPAQPPATYQAIVSIDNQDEGVIIHAPADHQVAALNDAVTRPTWPAWPARSTRPMRLMRPVRPARLNRPERPVRPVRLTSPTSPAQLAPGLAGTLALLAFFGITLKGVSGLIAPNGQWIWFAAALLALAAIDTSIGYAFGVLAPRKPHKPSKPRKSSKPNEPNKSNASNKPHKPNQRGNITLTPRTRDTRPIWRLVGFVTVTCIAMAVLVITHLQTDLATIWRWSQSQYNGAPATFGDKVADSWNLCITAIKSGFDSLNLQLPPLNVAPRADLFLIVLVAALAIVIRIMLVWRGTIPVMVALPVAALAADYALVGHAASLWTIGLIVVAFPVALWTARPNRLVATAVFAKQETKRRRTTSKAANPATRQTSRTASVSPISGMPLHFGANRAFAIPAIALNATPLISAALAAAITLPLTGPAYSLAYRVPLSIGEGGGMFTSNTVNPMIDLKRNIVAGSDNTVLTYQAYKRTYLRLTTLDDFDGDTWGYDRQFALDAGLYGSGIQLGRNLSDELSNEQRRNTDPLQAYMSLLGYSGYQVSITNGNTLEQFMTSAEIHIDSLKSRFLPVPGNVVYLGEGVDGDWLLYQDGTVYNRATGTSSDTNYMVYGTSLEPITSSSGFSQLSIVQDAQDLLLGGPQTDDEQLQRWYQARRDLGDSGLGEVHGDFVIIRGTVSGDGVVTGANGWQLGRARGSDIKGNTSWGRNDIVFNTTVTDQIGLGKDGYVIASNQNGDIAIVLPLTSNPSRIDSRVSSGKDSGARRQSGGSADSSADDSRDGSADGSGSGTANADSANADSAHAGDSLDLTLGRDGGRSSEGNNYFSMDWGNIATDLLQREAPELANLLFMPGEDDRAAPFRQHAERVIANSGNRAHSDRYTSLPKTLPANVRAVVKQAQAAGVPVNGASYDDQVRAMRWLVDYFTNPSNNFTYSLDAPDGDGRNNLSVLNDFLDPETGHEGYCQHYASALAVLGRALGVPTRVVLGYNAGVEERDKDGFYAVKSKQLHAWTEAYLDGVGWVPFDVTPATTENGSASDSTSSSSSSSAQSDSATTDQSTSGTDLPGTVASPSDQSANDGTRADSADNADESGKKKSKAAAADGGARHWTIFGIVDWPLWARVALGVCAVLVLVGLALGAPRLWVWLRRRRCYRAIARAAAAERAAAGAGGGDGDAGDGDAGDDDAGDDDSVAGSAGGRAASSDDADGSRGKEQAARAWTLTWREIQRTAHVKPKPADTDMALADWIAGRRPVDADFVRDVARNATASIFHGTPGSVGDLAERLKTFCTRRQ